MRRIFLGLLTLSLVAIHVSTATACLNDREVNNAEKEFKSRYIDQSPPQYQPQPQQDIKDQLMTYGGIGAGSALLLGAFVLGAIKVRRS